MDEKMKQETTMPQLSIYFSIPHQDSSKERY